MANDPRESAKIVETSGNFRDYLIPLDHPRLHPRDRDARTHAQGVLGNEGIFLTPVARGWVENYHKPFHGFTTDGKVRPDLWHHDSGAGGPTQEMVEAAKKLLSAASPEESKAIRYPVDAREWRSWSNPEVYFIRTASKRIQVLANANTRSSSSIRACAWKTCRSHCGRPCTTS